MSIGYCGPREEAQDFDFEVHVGRAERLVVYGAGKVREVLRREGKEC